ncbi:MAG: hypothetical protein P5700_11440 [Arthrospira platensis PCC 7345]|uniref:hypothetical protein n=1 Tax=Oscillatoriales TaxID=1150 RepID=UPI0028E0AC04|nr:hypothetical protein [Arthrospira platensis PCC 7345]
MARLPVGDRIPPPPRRHLDPEAIAPPPAKVLKKGATKCGLIESTTLTVRHFHYIKPNA